MITNFFNIAKGQQIDLPKPGIVERLRTAKMRKVIPRNVLEIMNTKKEYIKIPLNLLKIYKTFRPTPLIRVRNLEKGLGVSKEVSIYCKDETKTPIGSFKMNSALAFCYYAKVDGYHGVVCPTLAGHAGLAVASAGHYYKLKVIVQINQESMKKRPRLITLMKTLGAHIIQVKKDDLVDSSIEYAAVHGYAYAHLDIPAFQSIIGLEVQSQLKERGIEPNIMFSCAGSGTSFIGFVGPYINSNVKLVAVESNRFPKLSRGTYTFVSSSRKGYTPKQYIYQIHDSKSKKYPVFGLSQERASPFISHLCHKGLIHVRAIDYEDAISAIGEFSKYEKINVALESGHTIAAVLKEVETKDCMKMNIIVHLTGMKSNTIQI